MIIDQDSALSDWIKKRIVEICDAEPVAFAKYVLALLKKDSNEETLKKICVEQLDVFLGSNTEEFISSLFETINSRSYIPDDNVDSAEAAAPGTSVDSQNSTNSNSELQSKSAKNESSQRRRISPPRDSSKDDTRARGDRRRHSRSRSRSPYQRRRQYGRRSRSRSPRREHHRRERTNVVSSTANSRIRCRDFEEKGFCSKGEECSYYHPDPIVLDGKNANNFNMEFTTNPPPGIEVNRSSTTNGSSATEAYNPEAPGMGSSLPGFMPNFNVPPPPIIQQVPMNSMGMMPMNAYMQQGSNMSQLGPMRGFGRGRGRGRGRFGPYSHERVSPNKSTTIEVRRIPPEVNKLGIIHKHFEQFGDITNIQISFDGSPDTALVTYAKMPDAQSAMKSTKPILDNRFIQVSWHKPPPPAVPITDAKTEQNSSLGDVKPVIPLLPEPKSSTDHIPTNQLPQAEAARRVQQLAEEKLQARRKERQMNVHLKKIHMLKSQLYEKQVAELKGLYGRITKAADPKIKGQLALMSKKLDESVKSLAKEIHELYEQIQKGEKAKNDSGEQEFMDESDEQDLMDASGDQEIKSGEQDFMDEDFTDDFDEKELMKLIDREENDMM